MGNAMHSAMQYICYAACDSLADVQREIARLTEQGFINEEQAQMVDCEAIAAFFATELGQKLREGAHVLREFKFSILDDGKHFSPELSGEQILLQGVVDCALIEDDGITILDFKTDSVTESTLHQRQEFYRPQVLAYGDALRRIYGLPVKQSLLYFFHLGRFVALK